MPTQEEVDAADLQTETEQSEETQEKPEVEQTESEAESGAADEKRESKPKGKGGFQRRIDKLTRRIYELEKERESGKGQTRPTEDPEPKESDFNDVHAFLKAQAKWEARQEVRAERAAEEKRAEDRRMQQVFDDYNRGVESLEEKYEDFDEVMESATVSIPKAAQIAIIEHENGPEIAYYLAKHPDEAEQLLEMSSTRAVAEIGRIGYQISSASKQKPRTTAPAPVRHVGSSAARSSVPLGQLDYQAYKKARESERQRK